MADELSVDVEEVGHVRKVSIRFTPTEETTAVVVEEEPRRY
jgi:hypothetical protein